MQTGEKQSSLFGHYFCKLTNDLQLLAVTKFCSSIFSLKFLMINRHGVTTIPSLFKLYLFPFVFVDIRVGIAEPV
jgi:hypothetical protein